MKWGKPMGGALAKIAGAFGQASALGYLLGTTACAQLPALPRIIPPSSSSSITVGAERTASYLPLLKDRRVAVITNRTGRIGTTHVVDSLLALKVNVVKVFAPEHGFRGDADAGEHVKDGRDARTGLPLISLYGDNKKPKPEQLSDVDVLVFDIQDVGVRFYTYISTLHYVMEAAAEQHKQLVVLDRPNPNGFYVDGPVLEPANSSFVGMHPVPLVHGMTMGEYAGMINGEGWLANKVRCDLQVITCLAYDHAVLYELPVRPSPNLPNMAAVYLYPSLGLFEGTPVSVGRGTTKPFQLIGFPGCTVGATDFTPQSLPGAKEPPYLNEPCQGIDLSDYGAFFTRMEPRLALHWLIGMYQAYPSEKSTFFKPFFDKLAGTTLLREQITQGMDEEPIRASWQSGLDAFRKVRVKYLLYDDFH